MNNGKHFKVAGAIFLLIVMAILIAYWASNRDRLPKNIKISAGAPNGLYYEFAEKLSTILKNHGQAAEPVASSGSLENFNRLISDEEDHVDVGIIQGGTISTNWNMIATVTPLFLEVVHVLGRNGSGIERVKDLKGKQVILGEPMSGMRASSTLLLDHYDLAKDLSDLTKNPAADLYFTQITNNTEIDAAIVTTGFINPDLLAVLETGEFKLISIQQSEAIQNIDPNFRNHKIPEGQYVGDPAIPPESVSSIATAAFLAVRRDSSKPQMTDDQSKMVDLLLNCVHQQGLRHSFGSLLDRQSAPSWELVTLHPTARRFFFPEDELGRMANIMESLAATKELMFAIILGSYLLWERWRSLKRKAEQKQLNRQKEYLDTFLQKTVAIEKTQIQTSDISELQDLLNQVTQIKLEALQEFTDEELRGDQAFTIFLTQCSSLINKLQLKIIKLTSLRDSDEGPP